MYKWGTNSRKILDTCHPIIRATFTEALSLGLVDITASEGFRHRERQNDLFERGKSKVSWPDSRHNSMPSEAIDAYPFVNGKVSYDWNHCIFLAGIIQSVSKRMFQTQVLDGWLRWGGNWDMDGEPITDQDFQDLGHFEIVWR